MENTPRRNEPIWYYPQLAASFPTTVRPVGEHDLLVARRTDHTSWDTKHQERIERCKRRLKTPAMEFMAAADDSIESMPEGTYLRMANAAKGMYDVVEELYSSTIDDDDVDNGGMNDYIMQQEKINTLESQIRRLRRDLDRSENLLADAKNENSNMKVRIKQIVDMLDPLSKQTTGQNGSVSPYRTRTQPSYGHTKS